MLCSSSVPISDAGFKIAKRVCCLRFCGTFLFSYLVPLTNVRFLNNKEKKEHYLEEQIGPLIFSEEIFSLEKRRWFEN